MTDGMRFSSACANPWQPIGQAPCDNDSLQRTGFASVQSLGRTPASDPDQGEHG
jgi:hypothetical protein